MDQELAILRKQCVDSLCNSADYVLKYLDDKEKTNEINKLKTCVQNYCYLDKLSNLEKVKNFIDVGKMFCNTTRFAYLFTLFTLLTILMYFNRKMTIFAITKNLKLKFHNGARS